MSARTSSRARPTRSACILAGVPDDPLAAGIVQLFTNTGTLLASSGVINPTAGAAFQPGSVSYVADSSVKRSRHSCRHHQPIIATAQFRPSPAHGHPRAFDLRRLRRRVRPPALRHCTPQKRQAPVSTRRSNLITQACNQRPLRSAVKQRGCNLRSRAPRTSPFDTFSLGFLWCEEGRKFLSIRPLLFGARGDVPASRRWLSADGDASR